MSTFLIRLYIYTRNSPFLLFLTWNLIIVFCERCPSNNWHVTLAHFSIKFVTPGDRESAQSLHTRLHSYSITLMQKWIKQYVNHVPSRSLMSVVSVTAIFYQMIITFPFVFFWFSWTSNFYKNTIKNFNKTEHSTNLWLNLTTYFFPKIRMLYSFNPNSIVYSANITNEGEEI